MDPHVRQDSRVFLGGAATERRTQLLTLVFTDIAGSTQLKAELGDGAGVDLIQQHHTILREVLQGFEAEEISTAGDSFLLIFSKPSQALVFALQLQARLRQFNDGRLNPVPDRIGLHMGEVVIEERDGKRDIHGMQVDTCARVMSLAQGGQILMTRPVFDNARQSLKGEEVEGISEVEWLNHGRFELKGVEEPVEICEVRAAGAVHVSAPTTSEKARRVESPEAEAVLGWRPAVGQVVPHTQWILKEKLGEGGFGEVWLGQHQAMKERRVFKFCFRSDRVRSLKREMTLFRLIKDRIGDHPNIVALREVYFDQPPYFVEEEYVAGQDLASWCAARGGADKVPLETKLEIVAQVADALQAAHDAGVIHRDVKPGNILVSRSSRREEAHFDLRAPAANRSEPPGVGCYEIQAKLTDFGIGQVISEEALSGVTKAGFTQTLLSSSSSHSGTQLYVAPELLAGKPASIRSDIYSLGVVFYQLLLGNFREPVTGDWAEEVSDPLLRDDLRHCLAGKPEDRFPGASQLARNLRLFQERKAEYAENERLKRRAKQRRRLGAVAGLTVLVLGLLAVALAYGLHNTRLERDRQRQFAYASDIRAVDAALREHNLGQARQILMTHLPRAGEVDLRGVEWRYLWLKCQPNHEFSLRHKSRVTGADIAADGRWVVSECEGEVRVWDVASRRPIKEFAPAPVWRIQSYAAFSPTGKYLAIAGKDVTEVWDTTGWTKVTVLPCTNGVPMFSADGAILVLSGEEGLQAWQLKTWNPLLAAGEIQIPTGGERGLSVSRDGSLVAVLNRDAAEVSVWHLASRRLLMRHVDKQDAPYSVALSPDGAWLAVGTYNGQIRYWTMVDQKPGASFPAHRLRVFDLAFSPDSRFLASAGNDQLIGLWRAGTGERAATLLGHESEVWSVRFSADGQWLVSASKDGTVRLWKSQYEPGGRAFFKLPEKHLLGEFSADGKTLITVNYQDWTFDHLDIATGRLVKQVKIAFPLDLGRTENVLRDVTLFNWAVFRANPATNIFMMAFAARRPWGLTVSTDSGQIMAWEPTTGQLCYSNKVSMFPLLIVPQCCPSPDGKHLVFVEMTDPSRFKGRVVWWNIVEGRREAIVTDTYPGPFVAFSVSPDGKWMAYRIAEEKCLLRDLKEDRVQGLMAGHSWTAVALALSPNGRYLATGSSDATVQLWETASGKPVGPLLRGHFSGIQKMQFSADSRTLVTFADEKTARVWNVQTGREMLSPIDVSGPLLWHPYQGIFSEDDRFLLESDAEGRIRIIPLPTLAAIDVIETASSSGPAPAKP